MAAEVVERIEESPSIFTLRLRLREQDQRKAYRFAPGQFNMLYLYGVGEVAISIVSDPVDDHLLAHTIRRVGRVTDGLAQLRAGDKVGLRGPFGRGWPLQQAQGKDVMVVTGGLGCAPVVSAINYILRRREEFGRLTIMQGVRHTEDLIWRERYDEWAAQPDTEVLLAASRGGETWPYHKGHVPDLFPCVEIDHANTIAMMCGPEGMMQGSAEALLRCGVAASDIWLSLERNMQCGRGKCGHCQLGPHFVCKDGPVFSYDELLPLLGRKGL
jgi:NAD(P)H-flavin reductase